MSEAYRTTEELAWGLEFGQNLQRMIRIKGTTQALLAKKLGTTNAMLSRYVNGLSAPSVYKVCRIAQLLDCSVDDLVKPHYEE